MMPIQVYISISEPWDLGEALEWQPVQGEILKFNAEPHADRALIRLLNPIAHSGKIYRYVVATPRVKKLRVTSLSKGQSLGCAFIGIDDEQVSAVDPMETSSWRGGLAFIGDIRVGAVNGVPIVP